MIRQGSCRSVGKLHTLSGTSKELSPSPQSCKFITGLDGSRWELGDLEPDHRKARDEKGAPSHRREELKRKLGSRKGIEHLQRHSAQPSSDYTSRQRTRKKRPQGSGSPRPVAG